MMWYDMVGVTFCKPNKPSARKPTWQMPHWNAHGSIENAENYEGGSHAGKKSTADDPAFTNLANNLSSA